MNIIFDNIIFSLQKEGGVSGVWKELISRTIKNNDFSYLFLEYCHAKENLYRKELELSSNSIIGINNKYLLFEKYLSPNISTDSNFLFHSSYYRICKHKKARNITTVHDFIYEYYRNGLPKLIHHQQKKNAILSSEAIICVSQNTKQDLLKFFPEVKEDRIFVIYNGVSEAYKSFVTNNKPEHIAIFGRYILFIGNRTQPHKNFLPIIFALKKHPELNLVLVGGGSLSDHEKNLFDQHIKNRYYHLSNIKNDELNIIYNYAFSLVYPSHYEGFGMPIIEAQKSGCPVIAKKGSSISEVAGNAALLTENGNFEELSQKIELLKQQNIRLDLISKGFINASRFSWDKMAKEVSQIYYSLL